MPLHNILSQVLFAFSGGAVVDAVGIDVREMNYIDAVLDIQGSESTVAVDDFVVENNDLSGLDSHSWTGVLSDAATASLSNVRFCGNSLVDNVVSSSGGSVVTIETAKVCDTAGGAVLVGAVVLVRLCSSY